MMRGCLLHRWWEAVCCMLVGGFVDPHNGVFDLTPHTLGQSILSWEDVPIPSREDCLWVDANAAGACSLSLCLSLSMCVSLRSLWIASCPPNMSYCHAWHLLWAAARENSYIDWPFAASPSFFEAIRSRFGLITGWIGLVYPIRQSTVLTEVLRTHLDLLGRRFYSYFAQRFIPNSKPTVRERQHTHPFINDTHRRGMRTMSTESWQYCNSVRVRIARFVLGG